MNTFFYDSKCGMCSSFVSFLQSKVDSSNLSFKCLHSEYSKFTIQSITGRDPNMKTSYLLLGSSLREKSDAIFYSINLSNSRFIRYGIMPFIWANQFICMNKFFNFFYDQVSKRRKTCRVKFSSLE